jgi:c-di-GMP-related signal transduction protein
MTFEHQDLSVPDQSRDRFRFFAVQPIFSRSQEVVAYEALYRPGFQDFFHGDGNAASRVMIDNQLLFGYEGVTRCLPVFLNCTRETLQSGLLTLLPNWIGIEIVESVEYDKAVIQTCHRLKNLGYAIALDDFEESAYPPETVEDIYDFADFVKIDLRASAAQIPKRLRQNKNRKRIKTIAEKIECKSEFDLAVSEGFELFQGRYLAHPIAYCRSNRSVDTSRLNILFDHLDLELFSDRELEDAIACVPSLACRVLRRTSWLFDGESHPPSLNQAIQLLGRSELRKLISLHLSCCDGSAPRQAGPDSNGIFADLTQLATE